MPTLIDEAIAIAQEHGLKIIACGDDKAPIHKGWREKASSDPDEIRKMFSDPRAKLVGVPMGKGNDLIAFDIDYRNGNTTPRNTALQDFELDLRKAYPGQIRIHGTRNGGRHLIMLNPERAKIPRNLMPKLEMCGEGFQIIWPSEGSGYSVIADVALDDLAEPDWKWLQVREKMKGISAEGGLMDAELAKQVMVSDGEVGTRHDALLRMTYDFVGAAPDDMTPDQLCASFEEQFRAIFSPYIEESRLEELMHWTWDGENLGGSDLGNAMKGAIERHPERSGGKLSRFERPSFAPWDQAAGEVAPQVNQHMDKAEALRKASTKAFQPPVGGLQTFDMAEALPQREWVLSKKLERNHLSLLWGPPGVSKTTTAITWSALMAGGSTMLYEFVPGGPKKVVYWNGEDGILEVKRRLQGIAQSYPTLKAGIADNLRILSTDLSPMPLVEYKLPDPNSKVMRPAVNVEAVEWLRDQLASFGADVLVVDPLISLHRLRETYPDEMEVLFDVLRSMARDLNIAILAVHHYSPNKLGGSPFTVLGAVRHATELVKMDESKGKQQRIPPEEWFKHIRAVNGKSNNAPVQRDRWLHLQEVKLPNGDLVPVPHIYEAVKNPLAKSEIRTVLEKMLVERDRIDIEDIDKRFRENQQAGNWAGLLVADALGLTYQRSAGKEHRSDEESDVKDKIHAILGLMMNEGLLQMVHILDPEKGRNVPWLRLTSDRDKLDAWLVDEPE